MSLTRRSGIGLAVGVALMSSLGVACVLPAPGEELPAIENRPPRILPERIKPTPSLGWVDGTRGCPPEFEVVFEDPDADPLYYRVFVDARRGISPSDLPEIVTVQINNSTRQSDPNAFRPDSA